MAGNNQRTINIDLSFTFLPHRGLAAMRKKGVVRRDGFGWPLRFQGLRRWLSTYALSGLNASLRTKGNSPSCFQPSAPTPSGRSGSHSTLHPSPSALIPPIPMSFITPPVALAWAPARRELSAEPCKTTITRIKLTSNKTTYRRWDSIKTPIMNGSEGRARQECDLCNGIFIAIS